ARIAAPARLRSREGPRPHAATRDPAATAGRPARRADRARPVEARGTRMIPLGIFLLACAGVYLRAIEAAFGALMGLSLRLVAERTDRPGSLDAYLDDPLLLFIPVRLLLGLVTGAATALFARVIGVDGAHTLGIVVLAILAFIIIAELMLPLLIVGRDPER